LPHSNSSTNYGIRTAAVKYEATFKTNRTTLTLTQTGKSLWLFVACDKLAQEALRDGQNITWLTGTTERT